MDKEGKKWVPIEANPEVMENYSARLGLDTTGRFASKNCQQGILSESLDPLAFF